MEEILNSIKKGRIECSALYVSFIYCILINRISRNYSSEELSFLLGQEDDFVENMELFKSINFNTELYGYLGSVFGHYHFMQDQGGQGMKEDLYEMTIYNNDYAIQYHLDCYVNKTETIPVFQLIEEHPNTIDKYSNSVKNDIEAAQRSIYLMVEAGAFTMCMSAKEIHQFIERATESRISPRYIKNELDKIAGRKGKAPLKKTKRRSYGYRYIFHPDVSTGQALEFLKQQFDQL